MLEVKALIGYFDLDPNRAIALALQAFAAQPDNTSYVPIFRLFVPDSVGQTLGFLFQHAAAAGGETPDSLFAVAVALVKVHMKGGGVHSDTSFPTNKKNPDDSLLRRQRNVLCIALLIACCCQPGARFRHFDSHKDLR